jgi:LysM repeat protein
MTTDRVYLNLTTLTLGLALCLPGLAETPEQVQERLEQYRQLDAEAARKKAAQKAEAERRREQNREWQEKRRREEYARRWRCYGDVEIDVLKWRQQKDGTWVTDFKELAPSRNCSPTKGSVLPDLAGHRLWVKVRGSISIERLASELAQDETDLARLNGVEKDHQFQRGDWLVIPSQTSGSVKRLAYVDTSTLRRTPPLEAIPEPQELAVVRFGDSLVKIAQRYNLTISELLRLNPSLEAARLVVGTQIRLAQSSPGRSSMILGLKTSTSSGLSWPEQPGFGSGVTEQRFSADKLIGINCKSLMVNLKPKYESWGSWIRPEQGSADEQLVIDRCAAPTRMAQP